MANKVSTYCVDSLTHQKCEINYDSVLTYFPNTSNAYIFSGSFGYQSPVVFNRGRGRSLYLITQEQLSFLKSCGFTAPQMADILNVSLHTIRRRLRSVTFETSVTFSSFVTHTHCLFKLNGIVKL